MGLVGQSSHRGILPLARATLPDFRVLQSIAEHGLSADERDEPASLPAPESNSKLWIIDAQWRPVTNQQVPTRIMGVEPAQIAQGGKP